MREPVALLTPRPSLRVPRREMIGEPSPATSSKLTAYPPARLHSQDTSGAGAVGMEPRSRGGRLSVNPSRHHGHWLRGRTPSFAIGAACRSGKRRRAHELVSRHPNMLGICVGRNGLMIGIPKELLEKILALALRHCCKVSWTLDQHFGAGGLTGYVVVGSAHLVNVHTHHTLRARGHPSDPLVVYPEIFHRIL